MTISLKNIFKNFILNLMEREGVARGSHSVGLSGIKNDHAHLFAREKIYLFTPTVICTFVVPVCPVVSTHLTVSITEDAIAELSIL